jgi:hypothetical protein
VVIASAKGLPRQRYVYLPKHFDPAARGEVMMWYHRWKESDVHVFYAYGDGAEPISATTARVGETVRRLGGEVTTVHRAQAWKYFPRVGEAALRDGFYDRMDALQGMRRTYYAGELLGFGTVEGAVSQARDLVTRAVGS